MKELNLDEDDGLAQLIIDALADARIVNKEDFTEAVQVVSNEIIVRSSLEESHEEQIRKVESQIQE